MLESLTANHEVHEFGFDRPQILLVLSFDPVGRINFEFELICTLLEHVNNTVGLLIHRRLVDKDPFLVVQVYCFLNGQSS